MASSEDDLMFTFEQSTVHVSDYATLNNNIWLNDTIIGFCYDIFTHKIYADAPKNSLLFVHPTTVNVIKFENDEEDLIPLIEGSGMQDYDYIFLPINNSQSMFSVSGSHWALLIYQRHNNIFYYLDSAGFYNLTYAKKMANKIYPYINIKKQEVNNNENNNENDEKKQDNNNNNNENIDYCKVLNNFVKLEVPQQANSYDCGMYVVEFTRFIAKYYLENNKVSDDGKNKQYSCVSNAQTIFFNKKNPLDTEYMIQMRKEWKTIIANMSKAATNKK